jgi:putative glutathione S-transferase
MRALQGLEDTITVSFTHPLMLDHGWTFLPGDGVVPDTVNDKQYLYEIYQLADPDYTGRVTVPVLWDKQKRTIVNNESADIMRMFNSTFVELELQQTHTDYYPEEKRQDIDEINARIYDTVNNGVYKAGFAGSQTAYDEAVEALFDTLRWLETHLATHRFLLGAESTEADWRLLPTLLRFDAIYAVHFKCSHKRIIDYPYLWAYTRDLYQHPGIADTFNLQLTMQQYYGSHQRLNPRGLLPMPPELAFDAPHRRHLMHQSRAMQESEDTVVGPRIGAPDVNP